MEPDKMKKDSKRNRRIRNLVLICVLSALLLTVGTYAWFIGMRGSAGEKEGPPYSSLLKLYKARRERVG